MTDIQLGDKVKCIYTGFTGVVVSKTEYINGCIQCGVAPHVKSGEKYPEEIGIDEGSLKVISKVLRKKADNYDGGPMRVSKKMRGF